MHRKLQKSLCHMHKHISMKIHVSHSFPKHTCSTVQPSLFPFSFFFFPWMVIIGLRESFAVLTLLIFSQLLCTNSNSCYSGVSCIYIFWNMLWRPGFCFCHCKKRIKDQTKTRVINLTPWENVCVCCLSSTVTHRRPRHESSDLLLHHFAPSSTSLCACITPHTTQGFHKVQRNKTFNM